MIRFATIGDTNITVPLESELSAGGSVAALDDASIILVGASSLIEATELLEQLSPDQRARSVLVGIRGSLEMQIVPRPGSLAALLERFQIAGALFDVGTPFGFAGRKDSVGPMEVIYLKRFQSPTYGEWHGLDRYANRSAFLLRLATVL